MNIFVGNLNFASTEEEVRELFEPYGEVTSCHLITDRETGRSRGFAFVEMSNDDQAREAIKSLNGADFGGRNIKVNVATEKPDRGSGGGGGRDRRSGGGGGGGRGGYRGGGGGGGYRGSGGEGRR